MLFIVALCCLVQAFAVGGQLVGAIIYAAENCPPERRSMYTAVAMAGANSGSLLGACISVLVRAICGPELVKAWAWRIPFWLGFIISVVSYMVQRGRGYDIILWAIYYAIDRAR